MDSRALKLGADAAHSRFGGAAMHPVGGAARPAIFEMRACDRERPLTAATIVTFHARHHSDTALAYERQLDCSQVEQWQCRQNCVAPILARLLFIAAVAHGR